jgi:hypothetical protein
MIGVISYNGDLYFKDGDLIEIDQNMISTLGLKLVDKCMCKTQDGRDVAFFAAERPLPEELKVIVDTKKLTHDAYCVLTAYLIMSAGVIALQEDGDVRVVLGMIQKIVNHKYFKGE